MYVHISLSIKSKQLEQLEWAERPVAIMPTVAGCGPSSWPAQPLIGPSHPDWGWGLLANLPRPHPLAGQPQLGQVGQTPLMHEFVNQA